jgi:DNA-binding response OmpR family regulator
VPLDCLLLTADATLLSAVQASLSVYEVNLEVRKDVSSALELANRRHFDGFVVDCDGVPGGLEVITGIRQSSANRKQAIILAIVNGATGISTAFDSGAQFVIGKPIDKGRLRPFLETAIPQMEREHRRYFRYFVELAVQLYPARDEEISTGMVNVSEGGLAVNAGAVLKIDEIVTVEFEIPSLEPHPFSAKAQVVWSSGARTGMRFLFIEQACRTVFSSWLEMLACQENSRKFNVIDR